MTQLIRGDHKGMKIFTVGLIIISALAISNIVLTPSIALQASSKGLKLYLIVDTNRNDDILDHIEK